MAILKTLIKGAHKMIKNHSEEQNVICSDCGEEVEIEYTKFCSNEIVCNQCIIDSGGDHFPDDLGNF